MADTELMKVPIAARYRIEKGQIKHISSTYADITPDQFARFLLNKFGYDTVFKSGEETK